MPQIGMIDYLNSLPYRLGLEQKGADLILGVPTTLNRLLRENKLDLSLVSCTEYFDGEYELVPGYGIGAFKEILSVNLYLKGRLDGGQIALTSQSAASVSLLKVLCHHFWKVTPHFVPYQEGEEYDGVLLIGDEALHNLTLAGYKTIDLAHAWYEMTKLPFVFAVFAKQKNVEYAPTELEEALNWSETHREELIQTAHIRSSLPKPLLERYYNLCLYRLTGRELDGLTLFKKLRAYVSEVCT